jgi:hypothetical protein
MVDQIKSSEPKSGGWLRVVEGGRGLVSQRVSIVAFDSVFRELNLLHAYSTFALFHYTFGHPEDQKPSIRSNAISVSLMRPRTTSAYRFELDGTQI